MAENSSPLCLIELVTTSAIHCASYSILHWYQVRRDISQIFPYSTLLQSVLQNVPRSTPIYSNNLAVKGNYKQTLRILSYRKI